MKMGKKEIKQVIVMRRDLGMRKGKVGAQAAHAAMAFMTRRLVLDKGEGKYPLFLKDVEVEWMRESFAKVVVKVNDLAELMQIRDNALKAGLETHLIVDSGRTEFHGESTPTCLAIGPDYDSRIDPITRHLELW